MIKSLQIVRVKISFDGENESLHPKFMYSNSTVIVLVGPCHHSMARPQVVDRGTASDKEGSCE